MKPLRILVTGSRNWDDREAVGHALSNALSRYTTIGLPVLVHGKCPQGGADLLADQLWRSWMKVQPGYYAEPDVFSLTSYPNARARNQAMVDAGAGVCLAFAARWDSGTGMTARMARRAGIPVWDYGVPTSMDDLP